MSERLANAARALVRISIIRWAIYVPLAELALAEALWHAARAAWEELTWRLGAFARELSATECWHIVLAAPPGADCARSLPA